MDGRCLSKYSAYEFALGIKSVCWSPSSQFLAVGSFDEKVFYRDLHVCMLTSWWYGIISKGETEFKSLYSHVQVYYVHVCTVKPVLSGLHINGHSQVQVPFSFSHIHSKKYLYSKDTPIKRTRTP